MADTQTREKIHEHDSIKRACYVRFWFGKQTNDCTWPLMCGNVNYTFRLIQFYLSSLIRSTPSERSCKKKKKKTIHLVSVTRVVICSDFSPLSMGIVIQSKISGKFSSYLTVNTSSVTRGIWGDRKIHQNCEKQNKPDAGNENESNIGQAKTNWIHSLKANTNWIFDSIVMAIVLDVFVPGKTFFGLKDT